MGFWKKLMGAEEVVKDVTNAIIRTGDALVYTEEERANMKVKMTEFFPTLLKAYHPFKLAQRILAMWFSFLFGFAFLTALSMEIFNIYIKYEALKNKIPLENIALLDTQPIINIVISFSLGTIVLAIVAFYFTGGVLESFKRDK